ncbi:MAG: hypothetical protein AMXMBFR51_21120 [Ignavibacteriota bacterium]
MKTYKIDETDFKLKDLTLDEVEEVNKLITYSENSIDISNKNSKKFLSLVLEPVTETDKEIDFGKCKESTAIEVLRDFFTSRIKNGADLKDYFMTLTQKLMKQSNNISN